MPWHDWWLLVGMGCAFILLGIIAVVWGTNEERHYYDSLSTRTDTREFLVHWPPRPFLGALKIGGRIAVAVGVVMLIIGAIFWLGGNIA